MTKNLPAFIFALLLSCSAIAQAPSVEWQKSYGGSANDAAKTIIQTPDGGYFVAGQTLSSNGDLAVPLSGGSHLWAIKIAADGTLQWQKSLGGSGAEDLAKVIKTTDGGYVFAGMTSSADGDVQQTIKGYYDIWVFKTNANGVVQWSKTFGGTNLDQANDVIQLNDGGFMVVGETLSTDGDFTDNHGNYDSVVLKLDASGNLVWKKCYGGTAHEEATAVEQMADGNFVIASSSNSLGGQVWGHTGAACAMDFWITKIDAQGNFLWNKCFGGVSITGSQYVTDMTKTADGGLAMVGYTNANHGYQGDFFGFWNWWIVKINSSGTLVWQKVYGGNQDEFPRGIFETAQGDLVACGDTSSANGHVTNAHGSSDYWVLKVTGNDGTILWDKTLGGTWLETANSAIPTSDGGLAVAGVSSSSNMDVTTPHGGQDYWVVKLGQDALAVTQMATTTFSLYPNPANDTFRIKSPNPIEKVSIADNHGRIVIEKANVNFDAIDISQLSSGVYFVTATAFGKSQVLKLIRQ